MSLTPYFFLYPAGHFGFVAVTFFVNFPLIHVIVDFLTFCTTGIAEGVGDGEASNEVTGCVVALCVTFILIIGAE